MPVPNLLRRPAGVRGRQPVLGVAGRLHDPGTGAFTDLEGTPRRPQVIVRDGRVLRPLRTLLDSVRHRDWTGHAGAAGADPEDLVLRPDTVVDAATDSPVCLITAARSLP